MNPQVVTILTAVIAGLCGSGVTGLIQFLIQRHDNKVSQTDEMLQKIINSVNGLGHDRLIWMCKRYINEGEISVEDYDELKNYLYEPYKDLGGNGTGEEYFKLVEELPRIPSK